VGLAASIGVGTYWKAGLRRSNVLLTPVSLLLIPVFLAMSAVAPGFEWGGRTYRWRGVFEVGVDTDTDVRSVENAATNESAEADASGASVDSKSPDETFGPDRTDHFGENAKREQNSAIAKSETQREQTTSD
jgi:hypothetical protein